MSYKPIQSALIKIQEAGIKGKGCTLTAEECKQLSICHELGDAFGDFYNWQYDENGHRL